MEANAPSDPFLVSGFTKRALHLVSDVPTTITVEVDAEGTGDWKPSLEMAVDGYQWLAVPKAVQATWMRLRSSAALK